MSEIPSSRPVPTAADWEVAQRELRSAARGLAESPPGIVRQLPYDRVLAAQRRCTALVHLWLASALSLGAAVEDPRQVLSLDVDGVLESERQGFSATGLPGAAALRLLHLGGVLVLLNTARSADAVRDRVEQFGLLGGVGAFGACTWDPTFEQEHSLLGERGMSQLERLRSILRADSSIVLDRSYRHSVRASRILDGVPAPIAGLDARRLLDEHGLDQLSFLVAPEHTDFLDRGVDKATGVAHLRQELGIASLPLAAMGDAVCDLPMLRAAMMAFIPAGTLPGYAPARRQRLLRSRYLGDEALWDAACHLVPNGILRRQVLATVSETVIPEWFPRSLGRRPPGVGLPPRLAAALAFVPGVVNSPPGGGRNHGTS